jgi:hypothetical protein
MMCQLFSQRAAAASSHATIAGVLLAIERNKATNSRSVDLPGARYLVRLACTSLLPTRVISEQTLQLVLRPAPHDAVV